MKIGKVKLFLSLLIFLFFSCSNKKENFALKYINSNNLEEQSFIINTDKDTIIQSNQGIKIKIDAGSIKAATNKVTLRLKEALSLNDILKAGLTTQTNNGILSSDGMFYIDTQEKSTIQKPLQISLPTLSANAEMQLYKGQEENGKIIWDEPTKLETKIKDSIDGKSLFVNNCSSCHSIDKKLTGPDLAWIENRWKDKNNLRNFIYNPVAVLLKTDKQGVIDTGKKIKEIGIFIMLTVSIIITTSLQ
jgi:cytochrome c2